MFEVEVILLIKYDTWSYLSMCHENKMGAAKNSTHIEYYKLSKDSGTEWNSDRVEQ